MRCYQLLLQWFETPQDAQKAEAASFCFYLPHINEKSFEKKVSQMNRRKLYKQTTLLGSIMLLFLIEADPAENLTVPLLSSICFRKDRNEHENGDEIFLS